MSVVGSSTIEEPSIAAERSSWGSRGGLNGSVLANMECSGVGMSSEMDGDKSGAVEARRTSRTPAETADW